MSAYTDEEMDRMADEAIGWTSAKPVLPFIRRVLCDGITRITATERRPPRSFVSGFVYSEIDERFPIFDLDVLERCESLLGQRVKLTLKMSEKGTRYVLGVMALPQDASYPTWVCAKCQQHEAELTQLRLSYYCLRCGYYTRIEP